MFQYFKSLLSTLTTQIPSEEEIFLGNGDTEVFSTLIPLMEDLEVLKTCRLVCKSWNKFACLALRKLPWVCYPIDELRPEKIGDRQKLLVKNKTLQLPSPFGKILVRAQTFREKSFLRFLKYVRETTNSFSVELHIDPLYKSENVDRIELRTVLTTNQPNFRITQLFIYYDTLITNIFEAEEFRLPYLQLLSVGNDGSISPSIQDLCENICQFSPLKSLRIGGRTDAKILRKALPVRGMKSVENLSLSFGRIYHYNCKYVRDRLMEVPRIKKLSLYFRQYHSDNYYSGFEEVIEHFADSLESLTGDCLPIFQNKCFPKLREINFKDFSNFDNELSLPVERYPVLKRVTFVVQNVHNNMEYPSVEQESLGIEELSFQFDEYSVDILKIISAAGTLFPNVSHFSIVQTRGMTFSSAMLVAIRNSFPKLTSLELWAKHVYHTVLTGLPPEAVKKWLGKGWPLENIPRETSLLDFTDLEKLSFGPDVFMAEELFLYCLSKLPKLQYLTFYWNGILSAETIRDSVGHLKRITIVISAEPILDPKNLWGQEVERLRLMLPSVVESRKIPVPGNTCPHVSRGIHRF